MYTGKTLFAQIMDFLPWTTFHRIVDRYGGNYRTRSFRCAEQFRVMAFAQLTYRESLRDIETCLSAQGAKLYHMGFKHAVSRSTLADANESRDWRIHADFALRLIGQARKLYAGESLGQELSDAVYALDSTTIDLCLSMFPWAPFARQKQPSRDAYTAGPQGRYPQLYPYFRRQAARRQCPGLACSRARRRLRDGSSLCGLQSPVCTAPSQKLLRHQSQIEHRCATHLFLSGRSFCRCHLRSAYRSERILQSSELSRVHTAHSLQGCRQGQDIGVSDQSNPPSRTHHLRSVQESLEDRIVLQMDQTASSHQAILRDIGECREDADLDRCVSLRPDRHHQKTTQSRCFSLHFVTDFIGHPFREDALTASTSSVLLQIGYGRYLQPIESIHVLTGH